MYQNGGAMPEVDGMIGMPMNLSMDQTGDLMTGLDIDMLPGDLDLSLNNAEADVQTQSLYNTPIAAQPQRTPSTPADAPDAYALTTNVQNNFPMSGVGAGPLPTGFGMQNTNTSGSTLTEFTKRRNWSQRIIEELRDFLHILTPDGRILYVSPSCKALTGWEQSQLVGRTVVEFIHSDDSGIFIREFNESVASHNPLRFFYRFRKADGTYIIFESHGHPHYDQPNPAFGGNDTAFMICRGFFLMARPYPIKNTSLLDSFLEHKIENERLTRRIAELKKEETEEQEAQDRQWAKKTDGQGSVTPSDSQMGGTSPAPASAYSALAASRPDSITDKMARYEGATHIDTIEMLTGLRYRDGERSQGISTGDTSPALIRGDAGIAIVVDKDNRGHADKKKKLKIADEYVCTDCGTLDSPEWRKGPNGPKTLCNACGLRWAKKEKKRQSMSGPSGQQSAPPPPSLQMQTSSGSG